MYQILATPLKLKMHHRNHSNLPVSASLMALTCIFTLPPAGVRIIVSSASVCPLACLKNHTTKFHCTLSEWPWLGPPLMIIRYTMYFRFLPRDAMLARYMLSSYVWCIAMEVAKLKLDWRTLDNINGITRTVRLSLVFRWLTLTA